MHSYAYATLGGVASLPRGAPLMSPLDPIVGGTRLSAGLWEAHALAASAAPTPPSSLMHRKMLTEDSPAKCNDNSPAG